MEFLPDFYHGEGVEFAVAEQGFAGWKLLILAGGQDMLGDNLIHNVVFVGNVVFIEITPFAILVILTSNVITCFGQLPCR